jgi:hypothetical protein
MSTLMQASHQWASRPSDQRFLDLHALQNKVSTAKLNSVGKVIPTKVLEFQPMDDHKGLKVQGQNGVAADISHWSFGQLAGLAKAPAGYLRELPSELVADNLNYGLKFRREIDDIGILLTRETVEMPSGYTLEDGTYIPLDPTSHNGVTPNRINAPAPVSRVELRAATGPNYGRIWNADIVASLVNRFGDGRTGDFRVPGEFGKQVDIGLHNTTIYGSDRDMFVFLADEEHRISVDGRRNNEPGSLARGFFVWNSEVGSTTFGVAMFLFDYVCMNRIVWGVRQFNELRIRHTVSAPGKFLEQAEPLLMEYAHSAAKPVEDTIKAAQAKKLDTDLDAFLKSRKFTNSQINGIKATHEAEEGRPIETVWDAVTGVTAYAKSIQWQDERVAMERQGGKLLDLVAVN